MTLRAALANAYLVLSVLIMGTLCLPFLLGPRRWVTGAVHLWARLYMIMLRRIGGLGLMVEGRERLPEGPIILASKHQSAWDTFVFLALFREPAYVLKRELLSIPFYGWYSRGGGHIAIDRSGGAAALKKMVSDAKAAVAEGRPIVIFPQGTRVPPGEMKPYLPGTAALYAGLGVPVFPVALNSGLFWGRKGLQQRGGTVTLCFGEAIEPGLTKRAFLALLAERTEAMMEGQSSDGGTKIEQN